MQFFFSITRQTKNIILFQLSSNHSGGLSQRRTRVLKKKGGVQVNLIVMILNYNDDKNRKVKNLYTYKLYLFNLFFSTFDNDGSSL